MCVPSDFVRKAHIKVIDFKVTMAALRGCLIFILMCVISGITSVNIPPKIIKQSRKDIYYKVGESVKLLCEASGNPRPKYYWKKSGEDFNAAGNSKRVVIFKDKGTMIINEPEDKDESFYQCFADNTFGIAASITYNLRMAKLDHFKRTDPIIHTPLLGDHLLMKCEGPDSVPDAEIYWAIRQAGGGFEPLDWNTTMTVDYDDQLHIGHVTKNNHQNGNSYHCIAWNAMMRANNVGPPHYINPRGSSDRVVPMNPVWPSRDGEVRLVGSTFKIKCIFAGNPTPVAKWKRADGKALPSRANDASSGGQELIIPDLTLEDAGIYVCSASTTEAATAMKKSFILSVESRPTWRLKPQDVVIGENQTATFECAGYGIPSTKISWHVNGNTLEHALKTDPRFNHRFKRITTNTIQLESVTARDTMVFQCNVTNTHGNVWGEAYLNVLNEPPTILKSPEDEVKVAEGHSVNLTCHVTGKPDPVITWFRDEKQLIGGRHTIVGKGDLSIKKCVPADSGVYRCHARNNNGTAEATGSLVVRSKTRIIQRPQDLELRSGSYAKFTCSGSTDPEEKRNLRLYWTKDQKKVALEDRMFQNIQDNSLTISGTNVEDTGTYTCVVTNGLDADRASARLVVTDKPKPAYRVKVNTTCMTTNVGEVSWIPGSFNNAPIQFFTVEYKTNLDPDRWSFAQQVSQTKTKAFIKLAYGLKYNFRVIAINKVGESKPSEPSTGPCGTNEKSPSENPRNVRTIGNIPGAIHIEWTPVPPEHQGGSGFRYQIILHRVGDSELNFEKKVITKSWKEYRYDWPSNGNLYEAYDITISSVNNIGDCLKQAKTIRGYSAEGMPSISPSNIQAVDVKSEYVEFQWTFTRSEIDKIGSKIRGQFRGFKIQVWQENRRVGTIRDWDIPAEQYFNHTGDVFTAKLEPIMPNTHLMAHVAVLNNYFVGTPSETVRFTTLPGLPGPVSYMEVMTTGDNHINLIWDAPLDNRGSIVGYDIGYQTENGLHLGKIQERVPQIDDPTATTAILGGLTPLTKYRIHIWARTAAGRGESYFIERSTGSPNELDVPRFRIKEVGTDFINVTWFRNAYKQSNSVVFVQYKKEDGAEWFSTSPDISREWVNVSPLEPGMAYSVRLVATNGQERRISVEEDVTTDGHARAYDVISNLGWFLAMIFSLLLHILLVVGLCVLYRRGFRLTTQDFSVKTVTRGGQAYTDRDEIPRNSSEFGPEPPGYSNDYYKEEDSNEEDSLKKEGYEMEDYNYQDFDNRQQNDDDGYNDRRQHDDGNYGDDRGYNERRQYDDGNYSDDRGYNDRREHDDGNYGDDRGYNDRRQYDDGNYSDDRGYSDAHQYDEYDYDAGNDRHHYDDKWDSSGRPQYDTGDNYNEYDYNRDDGRYEDVRYNDGQGRRDPANADPRGQPSDRRRDDNDQQEGKYRDVVEEVKKRLSGGPNPANQSTQSDQSTAV